jgi:hypothetical protein
MPFDRITSEGDRAALRRAAPSALKRHGATAREFSEASGWDPSTLSKCLNRTNPANADHFLPIDRAVELDLFLGEPVMTRAIARLTGCAVYPLPQIDPAGAGASVVSQMLSEFGEALSKLGQELANDGRIDAADDLDGLLEEVSEAVEAGAAVLEHVRALRDAAGKGAL